MPPSKPALQPDVPQPDVQSPAPSAPKFRILKRQGWRGSFRLEEVFWTVLGEAARLKNMKIADYVKETLEHADDEARNHSSALRVHALEFLLERCRALQGQSDLQNIIAVALASPAPCFVLNAARQLINHNREFYEFLMSSVEVTPGSVSSAVLSLDIAVPKLIDVLGSNPRSAMVCGYTIRIDSYLLKGRARLALATERGAVTLIGYILDAPMKLKPAPASDS